MSSRDKILLYFVIAAVFLLVGLTTRLPQILEEPTGTAQGSIQVGGPFELVDTKGNTVTHEDIMGAYSLIYFGYTYCPDVCPTSLQTVTMAMQMIPARKSNKIVPILITIDPERDTPEVLAQYVTHFHPSTVGLSGSPEQIKQAAKSYRVYYQKVVENGKPAEDYLMDHSGFMYLMGPEGNNLDFYPHGITPEELAERLKAKVR